jgi:CBS domain-containing protein
MRTGTICQRSLFTVRRSDSATHAAWIMRDKHVSYLVVVEDDAAGGYPRVVGVLTDRDIVVTVVAREMDPRSVAVEDLMTPNPVTVAESEPMEAALRKMRELGVRRVPVVSCRGELVGILASDDILQVIAGDAQDLVPTIRDERQVAGGLQA